MLVILERKCSRTKEYNNESPYSNNHNVKSREKLEHIFLHSHQSDKPAPDAEGNIKLLHRQWKMRDFEDQEDYFCLIDLDYVIFTEDDVLAEWLEDIEKLVLDHD